MQNTRVFCPFDFRNGFRGHSRDSKRAEIDYHFSYRETKKDSTNIIGKQTKSYKPQMETLHQRYTTVGMQYEKQNSLF